MGYRVAIPVFILNLIAQSLCLAARPAGRSLGRTTISNALYISPNSEQYTFWMHTIHACRKETLTEPMLLLRMPMLLHWFYCEIDFRSLSFLVAAQNEVENDNESKAIHTFHKGQRFSRKLKRRLTQRTLAEARALKKQSKEAIHVLIYAAELVTPSSTPYNLTFECRVWNLFRNVRR